MLYSYAARRLLFFARMLLFVQEDQVLIVQELLFTDRILLKPNGTGSLTQEMVRIFCIVISWHQPLQQCTETKMRL